MPIDASAVARVLGIETTFQDFREGGAVFLPQRLMVIAQGNSDAVYSTVKFQATSARQVGAIAGWGSPAHLIALKLFPANNDGVGTIPVTFYLLADAGAGVAAVGDIAPVGTQTQQAAYRVKINEILSEAFVVAVGESVTSICAKIGEAIAAVLEMPAKVSYTYGVVTGTPDGDNTGDGTISALSVSGGATPGDYELELITAEAEGGTFRLTGPDGTVIASDLALAGGSGATTAFDEGGVAFSVTDGATDFEVGDLFTITVPATDVQLTSKWKGESANALHVEVEGEDYGVTFAVTQPTGGLVNPAVDGALSQVGNVWETLGLNALNVDDTVALDALATFGEGRWGALVRKPLVFFTGVTDAAVADAIAVSSTRRADRTNAQLVAPGSKELPFVVAARQLVRIARVANNSPPRDYGSQRATGLVPGSDGEHWDYPTRDLAVKAGSSTSEVRNGEVVIADVVTFYRPEGDPLPAYRHVVDVVKLQNVIFNLDLIFKTEEWDGAPLVPDNQPTVLPDVRKPKDAKSAAGAVLDALGLNAIISDPARARASQVAIIDGSNPKRLNYSVKVQLSGNANIIDVQLHFGFYFGGAAAA